MATLFVILNDLPEQRCPNQTSEQRSLSCVRTIDTIGKVLTVQPCLLFRCFRNIDPLYLEHDRTRSIIAASDHHSIVIGPLTHDRATLQR